MIFRAYHIIDLVVHQFVCSPALGWLSLVVCLRSVLLCLDLEVEGMDSITGK